MIVPFLFVNEKDYTHPLWLFYKYMQFSLDNDFPIIAEEPFFKSPTYYEKKKVYPFQSFHNDYDEVYEFYRPTDEKLKKLKKYIITTEEKQKILSKYPDFISGIKSLLEKRDRDFEKVILKLVTQIEKDYGKIDAILTWSWYPSLEAVCKKKNICLIQQELATFRPHVYELKMGYFQFYDKFNSNQLEQDYKTFQKETKKKEIFSREEILSLFLARDCLHFLKHLNDQPKYEFGVSIGTDRDAFAEAKCKMNHDQLLEDVLKIVPKERVSVRLHPTRKKKEFYEANYCVDHSLSSFEWILKNRRIVSIGSNIAFEAELLGRTSYVIGKNYPYGYGGITSLDYMDEKVCELEYLNYIIFGYFVPYSLMFDLDYIQFRMNHPSLTEIYEYHLSYLLKKCHLTKKIFECHGRSRVIMILKHAKGLNDTEIQDVLDYTYLEDVIKELTHQVNLNEAKYQEVVNSRSWKITKPLRDLKGLKSKSD